FGDGREVGVVDVRGAVAFDVVGDLVHDVGHVAHVVPGRPHGRARAERALIRASAGGQDGHRSPEVDAVGEARLEVAGDREEMPGRTRDVIDVPDALARLGPLRVTLDPAGDAFDGGERMRARDVCREVDHRLLALTD